MLDVNRNLLIILLVTFAGGTYAVSADGLVSKGDSGTGGIVSGITVVMMLVMDFVLVGVHIWMVYIYGKLNREPRTVWYVIPVGIFVVAWSSMIAYLVLLY